MKSPWGKRRAGGGAQGLEEAGRRLPGMLDGDAEKKWRRRARASPRAARGPGEESAGRAP